MKNHIYQLVGICLFAAITSGYGGVLAAWDFNESDSAGDGNTSTDKGWSAFAMGSGASDTVTFSDSHTSSNSITLTQGSDAGWTDRDRISASDGNDILVSSNALLTATYNELADGFDLNPGPTESFTLSGLEPGVSYRLQFIGGLKTDVSTLRNITLQVDQEGGSDSLFTADTTVYPDNYELTGYSEHLDFQADDSEIVLTFGEVESGQKVVGGLVVATRPPPVQPGPEPIVPPAFTYVGSDGGTNVTMDWTSVTGQQFDVYRSTNLNDWVLIATNHTADLGSEGTVFGDQFEGQQAFYRVEQTGRPFNKPNVILIVFDDLRDHDAFTPHEVHTPGFDRLAEKGMRFNRAYCQFPVCNSSRASFLTGLRPPTTKVVQNKDVDFRLAEDIVTMPQAFRDNGYYTVAIGKVFHNNDGDGRSWDEDWEYEKGYVDPINYAQDNDLLGNADTNFHRINGKFAEYLYRGPTNLVDYGYTDYHVAADVETFIEEAVSADSPKKPFFMVAGYKKPHTPYIAPYPYFDMYSTNDISLVYDQLNPVPAIYDWQTPRSPRNDFNAMDTYHRKLLMLAYSAATSFADHQMGLLLDKMDEHNLWDNTIVIGYGDHGYHLGEHSNHWGKVTLYELSARVPMVVYAPGMKTAGGSSGRVVELVDLFPTLAELTGISAPAGLEGESITPLLIDPEREWDNEAFTYEGDVVTNLQYTIKTDTHRYTVWPDRDPVRHALYDHTVDPGEYTNLVYEMSLAEINGSVYSNLVADMEARRENPSNPNLDL